ncbi:MAG: helix-turn-helix domain-containing protein [Chloroflexi bacterium]|nr:helix-turn-helix domain-containing protein [Chloroflexota bacterium]
MAKQDDWITTQEAAQLSGYRLDYIQELLREGKIKGRKWVRDWQVSKASLLAYVREAERKGEKRGPKKEG